MPIESGSSIADLDNLWPLGGDSIFEGDNHIRLIKSVLKAQFPGSGGNGFSAPITATEAELNRLTGITSNVQDQIDNLQSQYQANLYAPSNTVMVFYQATPPVGWTQDTSNNNSMLRVVSGAGGGAGGADSPISFDFSHTHTTSDTSLTEAQLPRHHHLIVKEGNHNDNGIYPDHPVAARYTSGSSTSKYALLSNTLGADADVGKSSSVGTGAPHNHGDTGSAGGTFSPRYISVITAVKD